MSRPPLPPIDFRALKEALLANARDLVKAWLPGGVLHQDKEYKCGSLSGGEGDSCSVNVVNGRWSDFSTGESGGDLLDLYAQIHSLSLGEAARRVAHEEGLESVAGIVAGVAGPPPPPRPPAPPPAKPAKEPESWKTMMPVPDVAPKPTFRHYARSKDDITYTAEYRVGDHLLGYVVRFRTSDGGKETLPYTWCVSEIDGAAKWHWRQWDVPRPLYFPGRSLPEGRTVVIVEGEKKADVLQALLEAGAPGIYCVTSWPGGSKAWQKALWSWLKGSTVILWPDCDAQRERLTKAERDQCGDEVAVKIAEASKPIKPAEKQPGMSAMLGLGAHLRDEHECSVQILPIPAPGEVPSGWDCDDAISVDGWDFARVLEFFGQASTLPTDAASPQATKPGRVTAAEKKSDPPAEAAPDHGDDPFDEHLDFICEQLGCKRHDLGVTRKLIIAALRKAPTLMRCIGFDQLRSAPCTREPWPWRDAAGPLEDSDDLRLGDYLSSVYKLKAASRAALTEAIATVADEMRFHPVRDWLDGLQWDGVARLDKWLIHVLGMDAAKLKPRRRRYLELMGRFLMMGLVARVFEPGVKFDYSPVFEGLTGVGKSTFIKVLVGAEFFSDTHFDIGNGKEGMEQLEGLWGYELSEMTAFRRADTDSVKQFFSSTVDRFRGAYGKYVQPHPRQCVIFCTTNKRQYLYDLTGNRRFWPVWINQRVLIDWLKKYRERLFAEALIAYRRGDRYYPTKEEEDEFFVPEQMLRLADTSVQSRLWELMTRDGALPQEGRSTVDLTRHCQFVTLHQLVSVLGADAAKSTATLENQVRSWLEFMGWKSGREGGGQRRRGYKAPKLWPPEIPEDEDEDDDEPPGPVAGPVGEEVKPAQGETYGGGDDEPF